MTPVNSAIADPVRSPLGPLPLGWRLARLEDITTKIGSGATPRGGESVYLPNRDTYALIRSQNVFDRHFSSEGLAFISDEHAAELAGVDVKPDDVLLNITGDGITFARACLAPEEALPARVNQHVAIVRPDSHVCSPGYLISYLTHPLIKPYMESFNAGGSRRAITKGHIESFLVPLPPIAEQQAIAHILGTLDDKIELNRRLNQTLEKIARALFTSWFVDFDPVFAKAAGRQPEGMDAETAALFPDAFVDSELGDIPEGWTLSHLGELASNPRRVVDPQAVPGDTPYIGLEHMPRRSIALGEWGTANQAESGKHEFLQGEMLFGKLRPYFHKVGAPVTPGICSTDILVVRPCGPELFSLVLCLISSDAFVSYAAAGSHGTRMPRTDWRRLSEYVVCYPSGQLVVRFDELVRPLIERIWANIRESLTLASLRDALLPRLLSGELPVPVAATDDLARTGAKTMDAVLAGHRD